MTNPNNIVRVRARNGGRASVYEANAWAQGFSMGILEGDGVTQNTSADMNVLVGGSATKPDVLIAQNPAGYKIALDIIGQQALAITAPASNSRISAIVAYTNDLSLSTTQDDVTGSPASCGLIVVNGTAAANPVAPTDSQIRTAITSDGATGSQAAYCVIATINVASDTTMITDSLISTNQAAIGAKNIDFATLDGYLYEHRVIWSGDPTSGNITFTDTLTDEDEYIDVYYKTTYNGTRWNMTRLQREYSNHMIFSLDVDVNDPSTVYQISSIYNLYNNRIEFTIGHTANGSGNAFQIYKIVAYKKII